MEQPPLGRSHRDAHRSCGFPYRALLQLLDLNCLPERRSQAANGFLQDSFLFALRVPPFRIRCMIWYFVAHAIRAKIIGTDRGGLERSSLLPENHERRIDCDTCEPS